MKIYNKVRGTMPTVPSIKVNQDTVYIRSNINKIDEENFKGWEYDEIQYNTKEYVETLSQIQDVQAISMLVTSIISELDYCKKRLDVLEGK